MDIESLQARIEHESAELRALHPDIIDCHAAMLQWSEAEETFFSLHLEIRRPQQQLIVNGDASPSALAALEQGFEAARKRLVPAQWESR